KRPEVGVPIGADRGPTRNKKWGDQRAGADAGDELGGGTGAAVAPSDEESGCKGAIIRSSGNREVVRRRQRSARRCASTRTPSRPHRNRKFADSLLEGTGFEPSVPREIGYGFRGLIFGALILFDPSGSAPAPTPTVSMENLGTTGHLRVAISSSFVM